MVLCWPGMFDTLAGAQRLAAVGVAREQAEVIAKVIHDGLEQGDHVTADQFRAGLAEVRSEIAGLRAEVSGQITEVAGQVAEQRVACSSTAPAIAPRRDVIQTTAAILLPEVFSTHSLSARSTIKDFRGICLLGYPLT